MNKLIGNGFRCRDVACNVSTMERFCVVETFSLDDAFCWLDRFCGVETVFLQRRCMQRLYTQRPCLQRLVGFISTLHSQGFTLRYAGPPFQGWGVRVRKLKNVLRN